MTGSHREDADIFVNDDKVAVFVYDADISVFEGLDITFRLADTNLHARLQVIVEAGDGLAVDTDASSLKGRLDFSL